MAHRRAENGTYSSVKLALLRRIQPRRRRYLHSHTKIAMKFLTTNFVKCTSKACDSTVDSFPLQYNNCELIQEEQDFQPEFLLNILDRLDWSAVLKVAHDLGNDSLPQALPENVDPQDADSLILLKDLHSLLLETTITEGEMKCRGCEHVYYVKNSIPNFLLPPHLA